MLLERIESSNREVKEFRALILAQNERHIPIENGLEQHYQAEEAELRNDQQYRY